MGTYQTRGIVMSLGTIILIILVIALLGGFSGLGGALLRDRLLWRRRAWARVVILLILFCSENCEPIAKYQSRLGEFSVETSAP